jgi:hypothetical protein
VLLELDVSQRVHQECIHLHIIASCSPFVSP